MATRSCLELMLDRIQQLENRHNDDPPALPVRPVSRARRPSSKRPWQIPLHSQSEENGHCDSKLLTETESFVESFHREASERNSNGSDSINFFDHFNRGIKGELIENLDRIPERGICRIQRCYRGHQVRCYYKQLRNGVIALQSFVRAENVRRKCNYRKSLNAVVLIQTRPNHGFAHTVVEEKQASGMQLQIGSWVERCSSEKARDCQWSGKTTDGDSRNLGVEGDATDHIEVPYSMIVDLQKQILRTEAKVRGKKEENLALRKQLEKMDKKWKLYEERMKSLERTWQDQLLSTQKRLVASKRNPASSCIQTSKQFDSRQGQCNQNADGNSTVTYGISNGSTDSLHFIDQKILEMHDEESDFVEVGRDQFSNKMHPYKEFQKLRLKFKAWKKEYRNKLKEAESEFKRLGHFNNGKCQKNWWGRFSH